MVLDCTDYEDLSYLLRNIYRKYCGKYYKKYLIEHYNLGKKINPVLLKQILLISFIFQNKHDKITYVAQQCL